jgi:hypothetical protein
VPNSVGGVVSYRCIGMPDVDLDDRSSAGTTAVVTP